MIPADRSASFTRKKLKLNTKSHMGQRIVLSQGKRARINRGMS
jgi:hypothetical protein